MQSDQSLRDTRESGRNAVQQPGDLGANGCNSGNADDRDQADEQTVLDEGRAVVILSKTSNKITHDKEDPLRRLTLITSLAMRRLSAS